MIKGLGKSSIILFSSTERNNNTRALTNFNSAQEQLHIELS